MISRELIGAMCWPTLGEGELDEMQNKAEAQPAWLQLAAGAAAGA